MAITTTGDPLTSQLMDDAEAERPTWRGVIHLGAFIALIPVFAILVWRRHTGTGRVALGVYGACLLTMLGVSATYHRGRWSLRTARRLRRLDHSTILLATAGTYTAVIVLSLAGAGRFGALIGVWAAAVAGVVIRLRWLDVSPGRIAPVYLVVGWAPMLALLGLGAALGPAVVLLLLAGGVAYSAGSVVFARRRPDPAPTVFGFHEVFHALVVVGGGLHLAAVIILARGV